MSGDGTGARPGATLDGVRLDFFLWEDERHDHLPRVGDTLAIAVASKESGETWSAAFAVSKLREVSGPPGAPAAARLHLDRIDDVVTETKETIR